MNAKTKYMVTLLTILLVSIPLIGIHLQQQYLPKNEGPLKIGFVYIGDQSNPYTQNFIQAEEAIKAKYGNKVEIKAIYNVPENDCQPYMEQLIQADCQLIFSTSYGYSAAAKELAARYPMVQFCHATGENANQEPVLPNFHTFMGLIYQGRYVSGIVAGLKLQELIQNGSLTPEQAKIGYVAAYPYPEVISGYTAFLLGVRSVVPEATMQVRYTCTWSDYALEKKCAEEFIAKDCVIIAQYSDTNGPAVACEQSDPQKIVYHIGYSHNMKDVAPTTSLISTRINWEPYMSGAVDAMLKQKTIESHVQGSVHGNDIGGGFATGWVEMLDLNESIAAPGTAKAMQRAILSMKNNQIEVFKGDYTGRNPNNSVDVISLKTPYQENAYQSAPTFHYVLDDVIEIVP